MARLKKKAKTTTPFTERIVGLRKQKGWTMTEMSRQLGVSPSYISLLESGDRIPSRQIVKNLAETLLGSEDTLGMDEVLILAGFSPEFSSPACFTLSYPRLLERALASKSDHFIAFSSLIKYYLEQELLDLAQHRILEGLQRFSVPWQLQVLLAFRELQKSDFTSAELAQNLAIEYFQMRKNAEEETLGYLYLYLAYFQFNAIKFHILENKMDLGTVLGLQTEMYANYQKSLAYSQMNIFILNEYARTRYEYALLLAQSQGIEKWEPVIQLYHQVISSPQTKQLNPDLLAEACLNMAIAAQNAEKFELSELVLGLGRISLPNASELLIAFVRNYVIQAEKLDNPEILEKSLLYIKQFIQEVQTPSLLERRLKQEPCFHYLIRNKYEILKEMGLKI
ncbi:hypothetical protein COW64_21310 [bacterium (Candidatus Blackallbacteria) CG18_big_fil_WC_8_21_14_2_50_49_26]|nr:MAG: hypothetical protein COW64_21310 [bacterium (Candidatus Blackallbacteria) CG18_big_fil_WC_8_21_14_2_50_49_26]